MKLVRSQPPLAAGFTLIEILVSSVVGTIVILVMMVAMGVGTDGFNESTRRIDSLVEARAALGVMSDDVSTMIGAGEEEFGWRKVDDRFHEIWFLTLKPATSQDPDKAVGDVCLVHYFTAVTQDVPIEEAAYTRKLYRRFVSSGDLLGRLLDGTLPPVTADPSQAEAIAFNVTKFVAQPLVRTNPFGPLTEWSENNGIPDSVEIDFQVIDGDTANLLRTPEDWNLTTRIAKQLLSEENENQTSRSGRDFTLNLAIGHEY